MPPSVQTNRLSPAPVNQHTTSQVDEKSNSLVSSETFEGKNDLSSSTATGGMYSDAGNLGGMYSSPYGGGMHGSGVYGSGMMGGVYSGGLYGGAMSPYGYGSLPHGTLSNLNQFLFGVQNVVFSLGQAVQVSFTSQKRKVDFIR